MNKHFFTLTELLMAIGIIVILAAIAIPTTASAIKKAEQAKAQAQMAELTNALKNYENTYGSLPWKKLGVTVDGTVRDGDGKLDESTYEGIYEKVINVLQATDNATYKKYNPRMIRFLDVQGNEQGSFTDPWGNIFYISFDADGDGKINFDLNSNKKRTVDEKEYVFPYGLSIGGQSDIYLRKELVIWSKGPDGKHNADASSDDNKDNVYSIPVDYDKAEKYFTPSR